MEIIAVLILCLPTAWALYDDRNGDYHPNKDLYGVGAIMCVCVFVQLCISHVTPVWLTIIRGFVLSTGIYIAIFPYAVVALLRKRGIILKAAKWWDYLSYSAWPDRLELWRGTPWYGRMIIVLIILAACISVYACPYKIQSYYNQCFCK